VELTVESLVFLLFSLITLGGGLLVVTTRNLFHGALFLMLSLFGVAGLFALLTAPFLAGIQVVVYIGAIAILIIFAIMLTPQVTATRPSNNQWIAALVVAVVLFALLASIVTPLMDELGVEGWGASFTETDPPPVPEDSIADLGAAFVDPQRFMLPFEVASILLMAALVGAVMMVRPSREDDEAPAPVEAAEVAEPAPPRADAVEPVLVESQE
jgi:NADH-quinone oxidoreductase subunit J